jgi:putative DNA primase/helicase
MQIARRFVERKFIHEDERALHHWRGDYYEWDKGQYRVLSEQGIRNEAYVWIETCRKALDEGRTAPCHPNARFVSNVLDALRAVVPLSDDVEPPCWLPSYSITAAMLDADRPPASEFVGVSNGILHLPDGLLWGATPTFFATSVSPVACDDQAPPPAAWLSFLEQLWPDDREAIDTLQEWAGYCLTADTSQQKILLVVGPPRSGKGTLARVLTALIGAANVCGPTLGDLAGAFGLAPLIGKTLAIVSDARLSRRSDQAAIVERLLTISGEDGVTIDRKHQTAWSGRLHVRFMLLTNELPGLDDTSGAFASRLVLLQLTRSFLGHEDPRLADRLMEELPAILNWAVAGWQRLMSRGHFIQPESSQDALRALRDLGSGMGAFVRDQCVVSPREEIPTQSLFNAYRAWREGQTIEGRVSQAQFGKQLRAVCPTVKIAQPRSAAGGRERVYLGISLRSDEQNLPL